MRRLALALALLIPLAARAYIPSLSSIFRRAVTKADDVDRSRAVTLKGSLRLGDAPPQAASLQLRFPLRCRLATEGGTPAAVGVRGSPGGGQQVEPEGPSLGAAQAMLTLGCPLLTYKGGDRAVGERALRDAASAAAVNLQQITLGRLGDRAVYVLGAQPRQLDVPQLWLYKDELAPARLLAKGDAGLDDLRLLEYGTPASAVVFPRVIELWQGGKLQARFEATAAGSRRAGPSGEDDDRD